MTDTSEITDEEIEEFFNMVRSWMPGDRTREIAPKIEAAARKSVSWRKIDSAPKDRNESIIFGMKQGPHWLYRYGWWAGEEGVWTDGMNSYRPTHWMRPSPPTEGEEDAERSMKLAQSVVEVEK